MMALTSDDLVNIFNEETFFSRESSYVQWMAVTMYNIKLEVAYHKKYLTLALPLALWGQLGSDGQSLRLICIQCLCTTICWHPVKPH